jgi:hypothetical protein
MTHLIKGYRKFGGEKFRFIRANLSQKTATHLADQYKPYNKVRVVKTKRFKRVLFANGYMNGDKMETTRGWVYPDGKLR